MSRGAVAAIAACLLAYLSDHAPPNVASARAQEPPRADASIVAGLKARCIGPANMGGRVCGIAVDEGNPNTFYVAAAGGGVWKTLDGGDTFTPVFDRQPTQNIGAVAICRGQPEVVYVGTGEGNPRNSVSPGNGVYRSADGGKTWRHCGLADTHHIGRVAVHPTDPDTAYVAALGHFWGPNKARGLFKTTDGGKTWVNAHFISEDTGFVDVCIDPGDPDTLYAAAWQVRRDAYSGGSPRTQTGTDGGIFKSTDAGKTWARLGGGLPEKVGYGRCGLSVYAKNPKVVFAVVHTSETAGQTTNAGQPATPVGKDGTPVPGRVETGGVFRSEDRGLTWKKVNDLVPRPFYYGQIRVDPTDEKNLFVLGVGLFSSTDGGKTFSSIGRTIHPDHHELWVNPGNPDHIIVGNDGGLYVSKDRGKTFDPKKNLVISQFYGVALDGRTPFRVYGGLQDNGTWGGPVATAYDDGLTLADWQRLLGADGFQAAVDPTDPNTVYCESQYGNLNRVTLGPKGPSPKSIRPPAPKGEVNRYNWNAPLVLSPHDPKTLYFGSQYLHKSTNRGDTWARISPDLSAPPKSGQVLTAAHNILTVAESRVKPGVLWVGTDDGKLWLSRDDGKDWADLSEKLPGVPRARAVSRVAPSRFVVGTARVAVDRHRNDDFKPYIFETTDYGETWRSIAGDLPDGAVVGVIRQSSVNRSLLLAGTELGLFVTLDGGGRWHHVAGSGMPKGVRVDDVAIHPFTRELVVGTHGRGAWVIDISPLEQLNEKVLAAGAHLFDVRRVTLYKPRKREVPPPRGWKAENPRGLPVYFLSTAKTAGKIELTCDDPSGKRIGIYFGDDTPGLDSYVFDATEPGEYTITLKAGDLRLIKKATVRVEG